jgi:hypothetical protein
MTRGTQKDSTVTGDVGVDQVVFYPCYQSPRHQLRGPSLQGSGRVRVLGKIRAHGEVLRESHVCRAQDTVSLSEILYYERSCSVGEGSIKLVPVVVRAY